MRNPNAPSRLTPPLCRRCGAVIAFEPFSKELGEQRFIPVDPVTREPHWKRCIPMRFEILGVEHASGRLISLGKASDESGAKAIEGLAHANGYRNITRHDLKKNTPPVDSLRLDDQPEEPMKMNLKKRQAKIGPSINTRTQKHGDEDIPGVDIPITGILLTAAELNDMLEDPGAHERLYAQAGEGGAHVTPRWSNAVGTIPIEKKFKEATATIKTDEIDCVMKPCKIDKILLERQEGGLTMMSCTVMSCTVKGTAPEHLDVLAMLNAKCTIAILGAQLDVKSTDQAELPLEGAEPTNGEDEGEEEGEESTVSRQIRASEGKKARKKR